MNWYKNAAQSNDGKPDNWKEMEDWFEERTKKHIDRVSKYCNLIADEDDRFEELRERAKIHDQSKFESPEREPYVYITWKYKCEDDDVDWEAPEGLDDEMNKATEHHVKSASNRHHPEFHSEKEVDLINRKDRDKPPEEMIDATKMPDLDVAEMVADWCSMSEEKGGHPRDWAKKNVNVRWKFTEDQEDLIYELIGKVF